MNTLFETATLDGAISNVSNRLRANNLFIIDNAVMKSYAAIRNVLIQTSQIYTDRVGGISRDEKELVRSLTGDVFKFVFYIESIRRYVFDPLPLLPADRFFRYGNLSNNIITLLTRLGFSGTEINNLDIGGLVDDCYRRYYASPKPDITCDYIIINVAIREIIEKLIPNGDCSKLELFATYSIINEEIIAIFNTLGDTAIDLYDKMPHVDIENLLLNVNVEF